MILYPSDFQLEQTTIWSFPQRGNWATHSGQYRGNWSPYIPRNLMLRYTQPGDWVLDQFAGSGTTLVEAKLLNRNALGVDINPQTITLAEHNLNFNCQTEAKIFLRQGDASQLSFVKDGKIDFICTHPPYADIIKYSKCLENDISLLTDKDFMAAIIMVAKEAYRVLKKGKYCAIMMGDKRCHGNIVPLGFNLLQCFLAIGFQLKEIIIKEQHNCRSTDKWLQVNRNFLLLAHEYIFVFFK